MASLFAKMTQLANSPKGKAAIQQMTVKAQQMAKDPKTRAKLTDLRNRVQGGRGGPGSRPAP
jgi:flagellar hook-associated protein FlgK